MQEIKDRAFYIFHKLYGNNPLMANVGLKTHAYFKQEGLTPVFSCDAKYSKTHIDYVQNETASVKSLLFKRNGLVIYLPHQVILQIKQERHDDHKVGLYLKQIASFNRASGMLAETNLTGQHNAGLFDEGKIERFLYTCLNGPFVHI